VTDFRVNTNRGPNGQTSMGLLQRALAREPAAWERLVELYDPLVDFWCRQGHLQPADVADVRQEVFLAVAQHLGEFRAGPEGGTSFRGWLRTITARKVCDYWRRANKAVAAAGGSEALRRLEEVAAGEPPGPEADSAAQEMALLYRRALELIAREFAEPTWRAFWRVVIDGLRPVEVAEELGTTANAVYLAKGRVLSRLREEFPELLEE
jgi:RNA polymerase sigma-70 factor, ECF subfamily